MCLALRLLSQQPDRDTTAYASFSVAQRLRGGAPEPGAKGEEQEDGATAVNVIMQGLIKGRRKEQQVAGTRKQ